MFKVILENGFSRSEYSELNSHYFTSEMEACLAATARFKDIWLIERDRYNRIVYTGQNHAGVSATIAVLLPLEKQERDQHA